MFNASFLNQKEHQEYKENVLREYDAAPDKYKRALNNVEHISTYRRDKGLQLPPRSSKPLLKRLGYSSGSSGGNLKSK